MSQFTHLVKTEIPNLMQSCKCSIEDYDISFKYMGYEKVLDKDIEGSYCTTVVTEMTIHNRVTDEKLKTMIDLLDVPVLTDMGYKVGKSYKQVLDIYRSASGWYILGAKNPNGDGSQYEHYPTLEFRPRTGTMLKFSCKNQEIYLDISTRDRPKIGEFLKALTGKSYKELEILLGTNRYILNSLRDEPSTVKAVERTCSSFKGCRANDVSHKAEYIRMKVFDPNYMKLDSASRVRFADDSSFASRALDKELAEDITIDGELVKTGTTLTKDILDKIDASNLSSLKVLFEGKLFELKKYVYLNDRLTPEELFTAVNMYACVLDGYDTLGDLYDLSSRVLVRFNDLVLDNLRMNISRITKALTDKLLGAKNTDLFNELIVLVKVDKSILIKELKNSDNGNSQQADTTNLVAYKAKENKVTSNYKNTAPADMVKVQDSQRNRTDPIDAPESGKIGKVHQKAFHAKTDENGFLTSPYLIVKNGEVVSDKPVYLTAAQEKNCYVASWDEKFDKDKVKAYFNGSIISVPKELINYKEFSCLQAASFARNLIPFPNHSNPKRLLMGSNHAKQAVDMVRNERPLVSTGVDSMIDIGIYTAKNILAQHYEEHESRLAKFISKEEFLKLKLSILSTNIKRGFRTIIFGVKYNYNIGNSSVVKSKEETVAMTIPFMQKTDKESLSTYDINPIPSNCYQDDDIVVYNSGIDIEERDIVFDVDYGAYQVDPNVFKKSLALGRNFLVAFKTFSSSTIDDAISIRQGLIYEGCTTSVSLKEIKATVNSSERYKETFGFMNLEIPNHMKANGLPKIGTYLKPGSLVIGKFRRMNRKGDKNTVHAVNVQLDNNTSGEVVFADIVDDEAVVILASINDAEEGDKLSGRHGNKGVIARVVPDEEMPFIEETGEIIDICLNPLGLPSRMNISQLLEVTLGMAMKRQGKVAVVSPFKEDALDFVKKQAEIAGVKPFKMIDGRTGLPLKRPVNAGMMYMLKAEHQVKKKIHSINQAKNLNATTFQPLKGKKNKGGQAFGEMETWCLMASGCYKVLQDIMSIQSDDVKKAGTLAAQIATNPYSVSLEGDNDNDLTVQAVFRMMGVNITNNKKGDYELLPFTNDDIMSLYPTPLDVNNIDSLHDENVFGSGAGLLASSKGRTRWGWVYTGCEYVNPFWIHKSDIPKMIIVQYRDYNKATSKSPFSMVIRSASSNLLNDIIKKNKYVVIENNHIIVSNHRYTPECRTGITAVVEMFKTAKLETALEFYREKPNSKKAYSVDEARMFNAVTEWIEKGLTLDSLVLNTLPVMPQTFRPKFADDKRINDIDGFYRMMFFSIQDALARRNSKSVETFYRNLTNFIGIGGQSKTNNFCSLIRSYFGKDSEKKGIIRLSVLSKRVQYSGRSVIIPSADPKLKLNEIGIPMLMGATMWEQHIKALLKINSPITEHCKDVELIKYEDVITAVASDNVLKFKTLVKTRDIDYRELFYKVRKFMIEYMETRAVIFGRQPSLHKFSVRAYKPRIVFTRAIQLNPLVCKGYNADFDGDQMYLIALMTDEACKEALEKMTPVDGVINPKDSSPIIEHSQDIKLGIYFATMLYKNAVSIEEDERYQDIYHFENMETLKDYIDCALIELQDLVDITINGRRYLSTAGRILFNEMLPNGFTDKPFENSLRIPDINVNSYCNLAYDGLIGKKDVNIGELKKDAEGNVIEDTRFQYYSLSKITTKIYQEYDRDTAMQVYQDLLEFGFKYSDLSGITLSLEDFAINPKLEEYKAQAEALANKINDAYLNGLVTEEGRKNQLVEMYKSFTEFCKPKVLGYMGRNNNLFIISDSGARGNDSQIMQSIGIVGVTMKTLNTSLETAILNSYASGLTSQELFMASYGGRQGVASTQNETPKAGFSTRQAVYMANGLKIVEEDCGKSDWHLPVKYTEPYRLLDAEGNIIKDGAKSELESFFLNKKLTLIDDEILLHLKNFLPMSKRLNSKCIEILFKHHIRKIECDGQEYQIRYKLDSTYADLFLYRKARNIPFLDEKGYTTSKTIKWLEIENPKEIEIRTMLDCESVGGVCQHCYGYKFDTHELPEIGEFVGIESAQSIGEPAAQLTMSLINQGGVAGGSVSSGVDMFLSFLKGSVPHNDTKSILADTDGYVEVQSIGDNSVITLNNKSYHINSGLLKVSDGEYVNEGDILTLGLINPDSIGDATSNLSVIRRRQLALLSLYHKTFEANNIEVHARHFEVLVRLQTSLVRVMSVENSNLKVGKLYELAEIRKELRENPSARINYHFKISKQNDVVRHFSGPFAALGFIDVCSQLSALVTTQDIQQSGGAINGIFIGEDLTTRRHKMLKKPRFSRKLQSRKNNYVKPVEKALTEDALKEVIEEIVIDDNVPDISLDLGFVEHQFDLSQIDNNMDESKNGERSDSVDAMDLFS